MLEKVFEVFGEFSKRIGHLDRGQWVVVLVIAVVIGGLCLKGMGSKRAI